MMPSFIKYYLVGLLILLSIGCLFATGYAIGQYNPVVTSQVTLPIKLLDADMARLLVLQERGGTYTRFAEPSGAWGITAVRMKGGIWVVPCYEVGVRVAK